MRLQPSAFCARARLRAGGVRPGQRDAPLHPHGLRLCVPTHSRHERLPPGRHAQRRIHRRMGHHLPNRPVHLAHRRGHPPPCANGADLAHYQAPDPRDPARYETLREALALARENGRGAVGNVRGPFSGAWQLFGLENFSLLLYDEPETVHKRWRLWPILPSKPRG